MEHAVARPYASAAFSRARAQDDIDGWSAALTMMADAALAVKAAAAGKRLSAAETEALILAAVGGELSGEQKNFLAALGENGRFAALPAIAARFDALRLEHANIVPVRVESARAIDDKKSFDDFLVRWLGAAGVRSAYEENPDLIGGVRVYVRDDVLDSSIRGGLDKLAASLV